MSLMTSSVLSTRSGMVRESKSPHSTPTFCVKKPNDKWCIVHAYNKLNAATIPALTIIPRKDVFQNNMAGCTMYSALDFVDEYYQLFMRASDIPLTTVSTPSGMLWEWMEIPLGLYDAPATFNRLVKQLFRPHRITHIRTLMTFLVIVVPNKVGRMLKITSVICEPRSSA